MSVDTLNQDQYFASLPPEELTKHILFRVEEYDRYVLNNGLLATWSRSNRYYNRGSFSGARLARTGESGEFTEIYVNHFRNLLQHILTLVTQQRPVFDVKAINTDFKSQAQALVAKDVVEYYNRVKKMNEVTKLCVDDVLQFADAYVFPQWDFDAGDNFSTSLDGQVIKQGDVTFKNFTPFDTIFDFSGGVLNAPRQWYILRDFQNKWDLMKKFPEQEEKIRRFSSDPANWQRYYTLQSNWRYTTDLVPVFIFIHDRTKSLPDGRLFTCISDDCFLTDSPLPPYYKTMPVKRLCAAKQRGTDFGYSIAYDLLPVQEASDGLHSTIITNQSTFGVQNVIVPKGSDVGTTELLDGLNLIEYAYQGPQSKPKQIQILSSPQDCHALRY